MPQIQCAELGCSAIISDPCQPLMTLFYNKQQIIKKSDGSFNLIQNNDLRKIDLLIEENLGLENHEQHFEAFKNPQGRVARTVGPKIFLLKCFRGHINQYTINCP